MKLDKNKTYFLGRLTKKEKRELFDFLKDNMVNWRSAIFKDFIKSNYLRCDNGFWVRDNSIPNNHVCAKELFNQPLTLENVQVDCLRLNNEEVDRLIDVFNPQPHYDNSKGSLYKVATERNWNSYIFDVVKRLERGDKKDPLKQEIEKSIDVLKIWLSEL